MKQQGNAFQNFVGSLILYGISSALGLVIIYASISVLVRQFKGGVFELGSVALALALLLVGLGLLQFCYLLLFKKESRLSSSVIYLASIAFMALGLFAAISPLVVSMDGYQAYQAVRGAGVFLIGLLGFKYARARGKQNRAG